ncbi:MAG: DNA polymerase III subunit delta' [Deltaproteobacteria bacterium]|nr:DNA polymerase III subunit delta' [Candidatus Tharpella sp.]
MPLAELLGQDLARTRLSFMVESGRVPPALLFVGPQGVGKALAALFFVQALSCPKRDEGDACGHCPSCLQVQRQLYPDFLMVEPEKRQIKIEQVRELQDFISFAPVVGERRVVIIKDAHLLNQPAANALLKTLEEPCATVSFILLSHRHNLLPATVLSRCLMLPFVSLSGPTIVQILARQRVKGEVGEVDLEEAAAWSGGSMERAIFFLDVENLRWCRDFVNSFSLLPGNSLRAALDLAEEASQFGSLEVLFFLLRSFLHDTMLYAQGLHVQGDENPALSLSGWSGKVEAFANLGVQPLLLMRQQLLVIERGQAVNVNLKLAFEAFFMDVATAYCSGQ